MQIKNIKAIILNIYHDIFNRIQLNIAKIVIYTLL